MLHLVPGFGNDFFLLDDLGIGRQIYIRFFESSLEGFYKIFENRFRNDLRQREKRRKSLRGYEDLNLEPPDP